MTEAEGVSSKMAAVVVTLVEDLFFLAKIQETAKAIGITTLTGDVRGGTGPIAAAQPEGVLVDLNARGFSAVEWVRALKADAATRPIRVVAFASHVQEELIVSARAAGCDVVMARSAFSQQLPKVLRSFLST